MYLPLPSDPELKQKFFDKLTEVGIDNHTNPKFWRCIAKEGRAAYWFRLAEGVDEFTRKSVMVRWSEQEDLYATSRPETTAPFIRNVFDLVQDAGTVGNTLMQDEELLDSIIQSYMEKLKNER